MSFVSRSFCRLALVPGVLACGAVFAAPSAFADFTPTGAECTLTASSSPGTDEGYALQDPLGYRYDVDSGEGEYATLDDGTVDSAMFGGSDVDDAYDGWGALFVGADPAALTTYSDSDPLGCSQEDSGRQLVFAKKTIDGLQVQRKLFVPASDGSGARFFDTLTNPTDAPITTNVYVGDVTSADDGDFGSDSNTTIAATSSGDVAIGAGDLWATTNDARATGSDPAIASVWGGASARHSATDVRFGATVGGTATVNDPASTLDKDQAGWGWQNITIPAGATYSFASWSLMRATEQDSAATQAPLAQQAAEQLESDGPARWYAGLTQGEVASVQNWETPRVTASIAPVTDATTTADTTLSARDVSFGQDVSQCTDGQLTWDFGDGTHATGATVTHRFPAGTANVTVTAAATCGGTATARASFTVTAPATPTPTPAPTPAPAPVAAPVAVKAPQCVSTRVFTAHWRIPGKPAIKSVTTQLDNAAPVKHVTKTRSATVDLHGKTTGTAIFTITVKTKTGKTLTASRTYHPCTAMQASDLTTLHLH